MNWYKKASLITPDPSLVKYMAQQVKPYVQTLLINKRIKELKEDIHDAKVSLAYDKDVIKHPEHYKGWRNYSPEDLEKRKKEMPIREKELQALNEKLEALQSVPKVKFPLVKEGDRKIEIDIPEEIIPQNLKEIMLAINRPNMKLVMYYGIRGATATYDEDYDKSSIAINIDLMKITKKTDPYQDLVETINHELVHNIQHLMGGKFGLPSKRISTPEYNLEGYWDMPVRSTKSYPYHSLLDIEFYPRLADRTAKLRFLKEKHPDLDLNWFKGFVQKDSWLSILKEKAAGKYQKAVNELLKVFQEPRVKENELV